MKLEVSFFSTQSEFISSKKNTTDSYFLFIAQKTSFDIQECTNNSINVTCGLFPHVIYQNNYYEEGIIAITIDEKNCTLDVVEDISNCDLANGSLKDKVSIITVLDGFSSHNEEFLAKLFENIDLNVNIIGGAAGVLEKTYLSSIFDNNKGYKNAAVLLGIKNNINIQVKNGWRYLDGPYIVTSSNKNILNSIDYIDAYTLYKNVLKAKLDINLTDENYFEISQRYPIGLIKYKGELVVRDPFARKDGKLVLLGEISTDSMINILQGDKKSLIESTNVPLQNSDCDCCQLGLVFNCISRYIYLEEDFKLEIENVYRNFKDANLFGVTTLSEVANNGNRYINLLNKTCVIGEICN